MELKVWVDGVQRVVCGVTEATTCHDVVIALAQAIGRTHLTTLFHYPLVMRVENKYARSATWMKVKQSSLKDCMEELNKRSALWRQMLSEWKMCLTPCAEFAIFICYVDTILWS